MQEIKGDLCHELLANNTKQALVFDGNQNYGEWRELICDKLLELVGMDKIAANACPLNVTVEKIFEKAGASENCRLVKTPKAHWWCEDIVWNTVKEETEKLSW